MVALMRWGAGPNTWPATVLSAVPPPDRSVKELLSKSRALEPVLTQERKISDLMRSAAQPVTKSKDASTF